MICKQLRAEALSKSFVASSGQIKVIDTVDHIFDAGTSYAIMGASGTGKSTLLHLLGGLTCPTAGAVYLDDQDIALFSQKDREQFLNQRIGFLFQAPYLIKELTVLENVMIKGFIANESRAVAQQRARQLLAVAGIADRADEKPGALSGGQQQRVALMRALFGKPTFLLADEPTGDLDATTGAQMVDLMLDCQKQWGMGIIVSTHDAYVAQRMQQRFELKNGKLVAQK